MDKRVVGR